MPTSTADLSALSRPAAVVIPPPRRRWLTRLVLPLAILLAAAGMLAYAARGLLTPTISVHVAPAVLIAASTGSSAAPGQPVSSAPRVLVQAPGWVEPDPYAVTVPALAEGVLSEVLVLEGQRIEPGQAVARMIDTDARLALARAEAELALGDAAIRRAHAAIAAERSRADELRDEERRKRPLVESRAVAEAEIVRLTLRIQAQEALIASVEADLSTAQAALTLAQVARDEAALNLNRMTITSPVAGVVLSRLVEPGSRISMSDGQPGVMMGAVLRLYDPLKLQVRVDVPIADAAKIGLGTKAEILTDALPDRVFTGEVHRVVHEANVQRQTVQFKVLVKSPDPTLKPEMLTRVRFISTTAAPSGDPAPGSAASASDAAVLVPAAALMDATDTTAFAWVADLATGASGPVAARRQLSVAPPARDGLITVTRGLRPGDRVILQPPPTLREGSRLTVLAQPAPSTEGGH